MSSENCHRRKIILQGAFYANTLAMIPKTDTMMNASQNDLTLFYPLAFDEILKLFNFRREKLLFRVILIN